MAKRNYSNESQNSAFDAGVGYGHGRAKKRVPIKPENQKAFSDGVRTARRMIGNSQQQKPQYTREDKIKYYRGRTGDQKLTQRQRDHAVRRLQELARSK